MNIHFEPSLTLGAILVAAVNIVGGIWFVMKIYGDFRDMKRKTDTMWEWFIGDPLTGKPGLEGKIEHVVNNSLTRLIEAFRK